MQTTEQNIDQTLIRNSDNAYQTIDQEFQKFIENNKTNTLENFTNKLTREWGIKQIFPKDKLDLIREELPIINGIRSYDDLARLDGRIVRYFCFVQDILEPEMQIGALVKRSTTGNQTVEEYLKKDTIKYINYRDSYDPNLFNGFDMDEDIILFDRNNVLATPIPNQNKWLAKLFEDSHINSSQNNEGVSIQEHLTKFFNAKGSPQGFTENDLNSGAICMVKFYESLEKKISLNQVVEVVGILQYQIDTLKEYPKETQPMDGNFVNADSLYPSALFPRIHVIDFQKHNTSELLSQKPIGKTFDNDSKLDFGKVKEELISLIDSIICDKKTSELLLINLVSRIYMKKDLEALGKLALNLVNADQKIKVITENGQEKIHSIVEALHIIIQNLIPCSLKLDITVQNLNNLAIRPLKDYNLNCLQKGLLQVPDNTFLLINETALDVGTLGEKAVKNVQAIHNLIQTQTLPYDFVYYETAMDTDIKILILSKGKTILTSDIQKVLPTCERKLQENSEQYNLLFKDEPKWNTYRKYVTDCFKNIENIDISKEASQLIQDDYLKECKTNTKVKPEILSQRLTIARYIACLEGKSDIDFVLYTSAKDYDL